AAKVGRRLADEGVLGRFAIDFVVAREGSAWWPYALEINLRKGGTTHPFLTLQFLTDGAYDADRAVFTAPDGQQKCFIASDHVESESYRCLTPQDLFDIAVWHGLDFDQSRQMGVVFHMLASFSTHGRAALTAPPPSLYSTASSASSSTSASISPVAAAKRNRARRSRCFSVSASNRRFRSATRSFARCTSCREFDSLVRRSSAISP